MRSTAVEQDRSHGATESDLLWGYQGGTDGGRQTPALQQPRSTDTIGQIGQTDSSRSAGLRSITVQGGGRSRGR